jgi:hypothetical protein
MLIRRLPNKLIRMDVDYVVYDAYVRGRRRAQTLKEWIVGKPCIGLATQRSSATSRLKSYPRRSYATTSAFARFHGGDVLAHSIRGVCDEVLHNLADLCATRTDGRKIPGGLVWYGAVAKEELCCFPGEYALGAPISKTMSEPQRARRMLPTA